MRHFTLIISLLFLSYTGTLLAKDYEAGKDYFELGNDVSKIQQITEYFSFYCPACFRQEPFMKSIKASLAEGQTFNKNHVSSMPGRDENVQLLLSQALITAKLLNVEQRIVDAIFNYIHVSKANFTDAKDIKNLFLLNNVDSKAFDKTFFSFKVKTEAKRMAANARKLREKGYSAVPTLVINNNYIPNIKSIKTLDEYQKLISYLLTQN